ncbi:MAG: VWA domain-containing protein [Candidatus Cloacimonadales bacterium]|jgi:Ca-activated chloride channel family protein|nr:VWA domain-containing protein [Candidatus Cloacimonadota bacterium]MDD2649762.1 VWA domain-containing protein [Candidatus Cloacimonadota bacterium]MDD3502250.1 VWA domain-containing protein [Candidatus Cloacimonadota bacterium]MDX9977596.1 VWA domain-containing protein [Candidatus Cloacimonadales bacterium]
MNWGYPNILYLLLIVPFLVLFLYIGTKRRQKRFKRFATNNLFDFFYNNFSIFHWNIKIVLLILALVFVIIAAARPQWDKEERVAQQQGIDIVICIDVSKSMDAADIRPSRLERAKNHISLFVSELKGDRVGLVAFAGKSMVICPLTDDYAAFNMFLSTLSTETITAYGTNIGAALDRADKLFLKESQSKVIVLISDGEDLEAEGIKIASKIAKNDVNIFTIGVGSIDGSPIELLNSYGEIEFAKDDNGNIIITKMDVHSLTDIAKVSNGKFYPITPQNSEIYDILNQISAKEKDQISSKLYFKFKEQYHYFLIIAFILLIFEAIVSYENKLRGKK